MEKCWDEPRQKCWTEPDKKCWSEPREHCGNVKVKVRDDIFSFLKFNYRRSFVTHCFLNQDIFNTAFEAGFK